MKRRAIVQIQLIVVLLLTYLFPLGGGVSATLAAAPAATVPVTFTIDTNLERAAISPYIYGSNDDLSGTEHLTARRLGGNRLTGYNWENNASSAGSDWQQSSDGFLCNNGGLTAAECNTAGAVITKFHDQSLQKGAYSLVTLQMAGYAAKDKNGTVTVGETAPSARWVPVVPAKGSAFTYPPNLADNNIFMDEEVSYLVGKYGAASTANGIKAYSLDNETALWSGTHPRIHPAQPTVTELLNKTVALAKAVKAVDPSAAIFGPASYGFAEFNTYQGATDWPGLKGSYAWFLDYYLAQMKTASTSAGKRLLDVLDVHWYPEAQGCGVRITGEDVTSCVRAARMQAPRTLWDPTYKETSWIANTSPTFLPILPRLQSSINSYYPGTKLAMTEFSYGGENDISGGIAMADALGIFGKQGVYFSSFWKLGPATSNYVSSAFKLYRNYDGNGGTYGGTKVKAQTNDNANSSVYASVNGTGNSILHVVTLNKSVTDSVTGTFNITSAANYTSARVWGFNEASATLKELAPINISGNHFTYNIPPMTALHIVLLWEGPAPLATPTRTRTPVSGPTATRTKTPTPVTTTGTCSPVNATIAAPFTFDGAGTLCWKSGNLGSYINSWNTTSVTVNGVNFTNLWAAPSSLPAKIGGFWYVKYASSLAWGHFEAK